MTQARIEALEREVAALRQQLERVAAEGPRSAQDELLQRVLGDRVVLESLPEIVCVLDRRQHILYMNRLVPGRAMSDVLGKRVLDFIAADHRGRYLETFESAWASGEEQFIEFTSVSGLCWQSRFVPVRERGEVVLMLVASLDTTARVAAERALRETDSRLRHAIDVAGMGTWTHDWRTDELVFDEALCAIYGISRAQVPRGYKQYLEFVHPEDRSRVHASFARSRASGAYEDLEYRIVRSTGEVRYVMAKGSTTYDKQGTGIGSLGAAFDITSRKRMEDQLYRGQKMEAVGQLTAGIAHNFNNVLSIILPNVMLCKREAPQNLASRLADIEHAAERAADLVRQLMLYSRRDAEAKKTSISPPVAVRRTLEICRTTFDRGIRLDLELGEDVPRVLANSGQLEHVLLNICINARDALESARTLSPSICIRVDRGAAGSARIRVSDNGPGMDDATRSRVFEPFFTTKDVGRGTGLGLASAYAIVRDHGGRIDCESRPGEGATFEIELPGLLPVEPALQIANRVADPPSGSETVFIIDDEPLVRRATRAMLEQGGYQVLECGDGDEALRMFAGRRAPIDLVILDRSMPGLSGDQVFDRLQRLEGQVPIVLLSGQAAASASSERAAAVLSKPVDVTTLLTTIRTVLDRRAVPP